MRDLAGTVGIQPASLYAHISSKEQLLVDLILIGHEEHNERLLAGIGSGGEAPDGQLRGLVREHVLFHATYPVLARVANTELRSLSPVNLERVMAVRHGSEEVIRTVVQRGVELGAFFCRDPWLGSAAIGSMGIRVAYWFTPESGFTANQIAESYAEFAVKLVS
jgi:AcrR family transcriptional regulator